MVFLYAIPAVLVAVIQYCYMPALNFSGWGLWFLAAFTVITGAAVPRRSDPRHDDVPPFIGRAIIATCISCMVLIIAALASSTMFRADAYHELLGEEKVLPYEATLPAIDLNKAPLVSRDMAQRAAEKKLSEEAALGSQVSLGRFEKQLVRGELYWVAFLEHRGFFKWYSEGSTPGYVMVSAHDASDVHLVTSVEGKSLSMKYLPSAFFGDDAHRHLYYSGHSSKLLGQYMPEIDESGRPFLVYPVLEHRVGLSGADVVGVLVLDVQTGAIQEYGNDQVPAWIDRIQDEHAVREQLADRLYLVHGWLNPSDKDRLAISGDLDIVYGSDGRAYYFAGQTSVAREGGMVSFALIDSRTKAVSRYTLSGVTESVAQRAAEGVMPEKGYRATNALPFTVEGVPTYVMALKDKTGIARAFAMVSIEDFQRVAVSETLASTARQYQAKLVMDRTRLDAAAGTSLTEAKAKVLRISSEVRNGTTTYLLLLEGQGSRLFSAGPDIADTLALTREGDLVQVSFNQGASRIAGLVGFSNESLDALP
ncbi:hypothetical protein D3C71_25900 [compost metagenome]